MFPNSFHRVSITLILKPDKVHRCKTPKQSIYKPSSIYIGGKYIIIKLDLFQGCKFVLTLIYQEFVNRVEKNKLD